jgi:hypothetical protein
LKEARCRCSTGALPDILDHVLLDEVSEVIVVVDRGLLTRQDEHPVPFVLPDRMSVSLQARRTEAAVPPLVV